MADSTIPNLTAVTTPVGTDEFGVRQSGDTRDKKQTRAQIHALEVGEHLVLPQVNEPATPTLSFGGDSGFFEFLDDQIHLALAGTSLWVWSGAELRSVNANGASIRNVTVSATNPSVHPNRGDTNTGLGHRTDDVGVLVAGSVNVLEFGEAGAAPLLGFYGTAAIAKQTGVAVSAAGIHAALVALGLIT